MDYQQWNQAIGRWFFRQERAGALVFLSVDPATLARIGPKVPAGKHASPDGAQDEFVSAVRAEIRQRGWRLGTLQRDELPSFLGLLSIQVLAVFHMRASGDWAPHNYWVRLRELLGQGSNGSMPEGLNAPLHQALWRQGLDEWVNGSRYQAGRWGIVRLPNPHVGKRHIALPKSQALLRLEDLQALHGLFSELGLQPGEQFGTEVVKGLVRPFLQKPNLVRPRTQRTLQDPDVGTAAHEQIAAYIADQWDGSGTARSSSRRASRIKGRPERVYRAWIGTGVGDSGRTHFKGGFLDGLARVPGTQPSHLCQALRGDLGSFKGFFRPLRSDYLLAVEDSASHYHIETRHAQPGDRAYLLHPLDHALDGLATERIAAVAIPGSLRRYSAPGNAFQEGHELLEGLPTGWLLLRFTVRGDLWGKRQSYMPWKECLALEGARLRLIGGHKLSRGVWIAGAGPIITLEGEEGCLPSTVWIDGDPYPLCAGRVTPDQAAVLDQAGGHRVWLPERHRQPVCFTVKAGAIAKSGRDLPCWVRRGDSWPVQENAAPHPGVKDVGWIAGVVLHGHWPPVRADSRWREPTSTLALQLATRLGTLRSSVILPGSTKRIEEIARLHPNPLIRNLAAARSRGPGKHREHHPT